MTLPTFDIEVRRTENIGCWALRDTENIGCWDLRDRLTYMIEVDRIAYDPDSHAMQTLQAARQLVDMVLDEKLVLASV